MRTELKIQFFRSTVESVLLYGSESWTLTKKMEKRLDGNYTRLLKKGKNITWKEKKTNEELYGNLGCISNVIRTRRLRFIGHVWRLPEETLHRPLLWDPKQGRRSRGRPRATFMEQVHRYTNLTKEELATAMQDREEWRRIVKEVRVRSNR